MTYEPVEIVELSEFEKSYDIDEYEVWDEKRMEWVNFKSSCYQSTLEFPKAEDAKYPINLITFYSSKTGKITTFGLNDYTGLYDGNLEYHYCSTERDLLISFVSWFRKQKFDIITGWNIDFFDVPYIFNRLSNIFGKDSEIIQKMSPINRVDKKYNGKWVVEGLTILDYIELYKNFTFEMEESYSLQNLSMKILGKGKIDLDGSINTAYKTDWNQFVEYNIMDTILVKEINDKKKFIELAITFASQALIPLDRIFSSVATIEGFILRYLHKNGMVMPDRQTKVQDWWVESEMYKTQLADGKTYIQNRIEDAEDGRGYPHTSYVKGGHVEANAGIYKNCISFDVTSLYPHMIIQYNISPETKVTLPRDDQKIDLIESEINGVFYKKDKMGVLPSIVKSIFDERKYFKDLMQIAENMEAGESPDEFFGRMNMSREKFDSYLEDMKKYGTNSAYFDDRQMIDKILINSIYGVMINEYFHFYDLDLARSVTRGGRVLIRYLSNQAEDYLANYFHIQAKKIFPEYVGEHTPMGDKKRVVLIDTDSNYICLDDIKKRYAPDMNLFDFSYKMESFLEKFFVKVLQMKSEKKGMPQVIHFKREGIISKQLVLAKKKYISLLIQKEKKVYSIDDPFMKPTGIDIRRSDTPKFCKKYIESCIRNIFEHEDKQINLEMIKTIYKDFKTQKIEDISNNGTVKEYTKYAENISHYVSNGLNFRKATPMRNKASISYNYIVHTKKLPLQQIDNGTKIKFIRLKNRNQYGIDAIAWIGRYPEQFNSLFTISYDDQFDTTFLSLIEKIWRIYGWIGETDNLFTILTKTNKLSKFIE